MLWVTLREVRTLLAVPCIASFLLVASPVLGQTGPAAALEAFEAGRFERAYDRATAALQDERLTRENVAGLLEVRARAALASGRTEAMERDARALASLDPERELGRAIRPELRRVFDEAREANPPLSVSVDIERGDGVARIVARVEGDVAQLVEGIELRARPAGGMWMQGGSSVEVVAEHHVAVEVFAVAIGPGGATLANQGTDSEPIRFGPAVDPAALRLSDADDGARRRRRVLGGAIGGAAAAVMVAVILGIAAARSGNDGVDVQRPDIMIWDSP